jgi:hypothetical protein
MKKILFLLLLLFNAFANAQNPNFKVDNGTLIWQWIYEDSLDVNNLKQNLKLDFITDTTGKLKRTNFNDKNLREQIAEFKIEQKQGKYRVTMFNIKIIPMQISLDLGGVSSLPDDLLSLEAVLIKKDGSIRAALWGYNMTEALHKHYLNLFSKKEKAKDDW